MTDLGYRYLVSAIGFGMLDINILRHICVGYSFPISASNKRDVGGCLTIEGAVFG